MRKERVKPKLYCLRQDESSHWYIMPEDLIDEFDLFCEDPGYGDWNGADFDQMRIDSPYNIRLSEWEDVDE